MSTVKIESVLEHVPSAYEGIVRRSLEGGRRAVGGGNAGDGVSNAVRAKCLSCCNWDRSEVRECTVKVCPLHRFRPDYG